MQDMDLRAWMALQRTPGISAHTLSKLLNFCDQPRQVWQLSPDQQAQLELPLAASQALAAGPQRLLQQQADRDWRTLEQQAIQLLPVTSPDYPPLLKETADPPPLLYIKGTIEVLQRPQLAMVGSRHCSRQGAENAFSFARQFAEAGLTVTSGCALGIDTESHRGALAVAGGCSVGVLGTGVDVVYPRRNRELFAELTERGALVSEFPVGTQPHRSLFPQRNRLISGLSLGVLVVEAALQSGSLITARFALEQNREVYAIPGSIHHPGSEGCHYLIQQGASLVAATGDIMEQLSGWVPRALEPAAAPTLEVGANLLGDLQPTERTLLNLLGFDPANFDLLLRRSGWDVAELHSTLTTLELRGLIECSAGCYQRLAAR